MEINFTGAPIIIVCSYMIGEALKILFKKRTKKYKLISIFQALFGGVMGIIIYFTNQEIIFNVDNIWDALLIGIISGATSTSTNQIIKEFKKNKGEEKNE